MSLNLAHFLEISADRLSDKVAVKADDDQLTYKELNGQAKRIANLLKLMGVRKGDKVAIMLPNAPVFAAIYYGILRAGATVVPVNTLFKGHEIRFPLDDADAKVFFVWKAFLGEARKAMDDAATCHRLIVVNPPSDTAPPDSGEAFLPLMMAASEENDTVQTMPDDTAVILYSSGTTGHPKGAELTHFNMFFNALCVKDYVIKSDGNDVALAVLPLFHSFGQTCIMNAMLVAGGTVTMMEQFEVKRALRVIQRDHVTVVAAVPTMYFYVLNVMNPDSYDLSSIRIAISGGAALPVEVLTQFEKRYGIRILEGYGLSETSPVASFNITDRPSKPGSIGLPLWGCEMRVMREDGSFAPTGEVGEIVIRGHNVMKGYYNKQIATEEVMVNGWFHTGDLARADEDGYFFIVDRKKDLIIRAGMNIYPREIEEVLYGHPSVQEAAVVGVPEKAHGEDVKAFVALRQGERVSPRELDDYCQTRLARYKCPKHFEVLDSLPKGPTGKILKRELRSRSAKKA